MQWVLALAIVLVFVPTRAAPGGPGGSEAPADRRTDEHSYAEPDKVRVRDVALDLRVDFAAKQLSGIATLELDWRDPAHRRLVLDTRDLAIARVEGQLADGPPARWRRLDFAAGKRDAILGSPLVIAIDRPYARVRIAYHTTARASGLQWLPPALTAGRKHPLLFTQSQAIHARSWVPLQDTPGVRFTYSARVRTPRALVAVMSADNDPRVVRDGDYAFRMPQAIPSYLLALAVGDLAFQPLSERAGVWAEPAQLGRAAAELSDTERMIQAAEALYGPYRWGRYDLLILPPSFPYGGMENPRLSFITPTVIVGDKSLVSLIAHELAHSWSGNLVTNATWKDVWLNEGFTSYVELRIVEAVYGAPSAEMEHVIRQRGLAAELKSVPVAYQRLRLPHLGGLDPDHASSGVAYVKGAWFLETLERRFGRAVFDPFLRAWFDRHAFASVTTDDFLQFLRAELLPKSPRAISGAVLADWIDGPGIPPTAVPARSSRLTAVDAARQRWLDGGPAAALAAARWGTHELVHFLDGLPETLPPARLAELDRALALTGTPNAELAERWYPLTVRSGYAAARPALAKFLETIGRRKLVMPTYEALVKTPEGLAFARATFARASYHPILATSVRELLAAAARGPAPTR